MELEFDNEIDALLRKTLEGGRGVLVGDKIKPHLDADEISSFAENALPETTRRKFIAHMADCDRCRSTLSDVIVLGSGAVPDVPAPAISETAVPWYRKLVLFPSLAYVLGGLVFLFAGVLAVSVIRNADRNANTASDVSQVKRPEEPVFHGPSASSETANSNSNAALAANVTDSAANTMSNATSNAVSAPANKMAERSPDVLTEATPLPLESKRAAGNAYTIDGQEQRAAEPGPPPAAKPADQQPMKMADKSSLAKLEIARRQRDEEFAKERDQISGRRDQPSTASGGQLKSMQSPGRNDINDSKLKTDNDLKTLSTAPSAKKSSVDANRSNLDRREISGKTFERKGVWYDSAYHGQPTTNIRRGTPAYKQLDSGLRSIGDNLGGTIVVMWKDKAYRID